MGDSRNGTGLRTIFSFFLGLVLAAFIGVGVFTFHPPPENHDARIQELVGQEQNIRATGNLTTTEQEQLKEISREREELHGERDEAHGRWRLSTSIILIVFSTLTLVVSLVRADQLPVISNGLLLGGVFTMLYGIGWISSAGNSVVRFLVMTVSLIVTLGLGWVRFRRRGITAAAPGAPAGPVGDDPAGLERRLDDLEKRMDRASRALGPVDEDVPRP